MPYDRLDNNKELYNKIKVLIFKYNTFLIMYIIFESVVFKYQIIILYP